MAAVVALFRVNVLVVTAVILVLIGIPVIDDVTISFIDNKERSVNVLRFELKL
jgi:hypothetical protein